VVWVRGVRRDDMGLLDVGEVRVDWEAFWRTLGIFVLGMFVGSNLGLALLCGLQEGARREKECAEIARKKESGKL